MYTPIHIYMCIRIKSTNPINRELIKELIKFLNPFGRQKYQFIRNFTLINTVTMFSFIKSQNHHHHRHYQNPNL